jgi:hypothetical protein
MDRACSTNGEKRNAYRILMGKPHGRRQLGRPRRRWVDNIKIDLREIRWDGVVWSGSMWLRIRTSGGLLSGCTIGCLNTEKSGKVIVIILAETGPSLLLLSRTM